MEMAMGRRSFPQEEPEGAKGGPGICRQLPKGRQSRAPNKTRLKFITAAMSPSPSLPLKAFKMQINQRQMTNCE